MRPMATSIGMTNNHFADDGNHHRRRDQLHFVLLPLMAQGHIIPMVDLGHLLASRGARVSVVTTPLNAPRIRPAIDRCTTGHYPIRLVELPFPTEQTGLPPRCENLDTLPSPEWGKFIRVLSLLEEPLKKYVQQLIDEQAAYPCIVSDLCLPWTARVARELGAPRYAYFPMCSFTMYCDRVLPGVYEQAKVKDNEKVIVPGLPHRLEVTREQARGGFFGMKEDMRLQVDEAVTTADGILVNSFVEMEPEYFGLLERSVRNKLWAVGPVSLWGGGTVGEKAIRGDTTPAEIYSKIAAWLDSMTPKSVLYVCFGTLVRPHPDQLAEIWAGLEDSAIPFLWAIKTKPEHAPAVKDRISKEGTSFVIQGWAPQLMILSHPSVGGFLTHCGWNSSVEAITAGVPMITWPGLGDQFLNEGLIVDVLGVGVRVGAEEPSSGQSLQTPRLIGRQQIATVVKKVMDDKKGDKVDCLRKRVAEVAEMANKAMGVGGSSRRNLEAMVEDAQMRAAAIKLNGQTTQKLPSRK